MNLRKMRQAFFRFISLKIRENSLAKNVIFITA